MMTLLEKSVNELKMNLKKQTEKTSKSNPASKLNPAKEHLVLMLLRTGRSQTFLKYGNSLKSK